MHLDRTQTLVNLALIGVVLAFAGRPVHVDEANFLVLARGFLADPWSPHEILINWQGSTERAFDVLSNPPGIALWLAPVLHAPQVLRHLWLLPWLPLAVWGISRLGHRFAGDSTGALLLLATSPLVLLAAGSLLPDLPLLALIVAGVAGFVEATDAGRDRRAFLWAMVAGSSALFRYSGICVIPLLFFYALLHRRRCLAAIGALVPIGILALHDLVAYGQIHILAMGAFQSVAGSGRAIFRKELAALAMVGGAGLLPVAAWQRPGWGMAGLALGAILGLAGGVISFLPSNALWPTVFFAALGGALLLSLVPRRERPLDDLFLAAWILGGMVFLASLRFMAARYWLPFLPALVVMSLRTRPSRRLTGLAAFVQVLVGLGLLVDENQQAHAQEHLAALTVEAAATAETQNVTLGHPPGPPRIFAGHWGWQWALEQAGWTPLEDGSTLVPGSLLAVSTTPWPQQPAAGTCLERAWSGVVNDEWPGPRAHTLWGRANLHAFLIAGKTPVESYIPWTLADDPREGAVLYRVCRDGASPVSQQPP